MSIALIRADDFSFLASASSCSSESWVSSSLFTDSNVGDFVFLVLCNLSYICVTIVVV